MFWHRTRSPRRPSRPCAPRRTQPRLESLEDRVVPYAATGNAWPHPELVSISFMPDGTNVGGPTTDLFSVFDGRFGSTAVWQNAILKGAQAWAAQSKINFTVVSDDGVGDGTGDYQQGSPTHGDIRVGGFDFNAPNLLAIAFMPPPANNYSIAGNFYFNTEKAWNVNGSAYDVFTVAMHEFGHSLGLGHSLFPSASMFTLYNGTDFGLGFDDVNGIRAIYGARQADAHDAAGSNGSFATASNITSAINTTDLTALVTGLDATTASDQDFYTFTAPEGTSGTLRVTVQSQGLSLFRPRVDVYNASQSPLGSATSTSQTGSTLTVTVNGVSAGQQFYVRVRGADTTAFATGQYALVLNFGTNPDPAVPLPDTRTPNGNPIQGGGGSSNGAPREEDGFDPDHDGPFHTFGIGDASVTLAVPPARVTAPAAQGDGGLVQAALAFPAAVGVTVPALSSTFTAVPGGAIVAPAVTIAEPVSATGAAFLTASDLAMTEAEDVALMPAADDGQTETPARRERPGMVVPAAPAGGDRSVMPPADPPAEATDAVFADPAAVAVLGQADEERPVLADGGTAQRPELAVVGLALAWLAFNRDRSRDRNPRPIVH